jgi:transcriptional regulator with XRE-family HTH domain
MCDSIKCKRQALGMTQAELGTLLGVSAASISKFEKGEELSKTVFTTIRYGVDNYIKTLSTEKYIQVRILESAYSLDYISDEEKILTLNHLAIHANKLALTQMKKMSGNSELTR